jgi:hypothetical protein
MIAALLTLNEIGLNSIAYGLSLDLVTVVVVLFDDEVAVLEVTVVLTLDGIALDAFADNDDAATLLLLLLVVVFELFAVGAEDCCEDCC